MSPIWSSSSSFYVHESNDVKSSMSQSEAIDNNSNHRNLSKVRSYLKRCEHAINNIRSTASTPTNDIPIKQSSSSWYVDELGSEMCENGTASNGIRTEWHTLPAEQPFPYISEGQTVNACNERVNCCIPIPCAVVSTNASLFSKTSFPQCYSDAFTS